MTAISSGVVAPVAAMSRKSCSQPPGVTMANIWPGSSPMLRHSCSTKGGSVMTVPGPASNSSVPQRKR